MKTRYIPMSIREFELMQYPFGWKAEYADGNAIFTPRELYVSTQVKIQRRSVSTSYHLIPANPSFKPQIISAFFDCFQDIYDQFYIRLKYAWFRHEIWRHEQLGLPDRIEELTRRRDDWHSQLQDDWKFIM